MANFNETPAERDSKMQIQTIEHDDCWTVTVDDAEVFRGTEAEAARHADGVSRKAMADDLLEKIQFIEEDTGEKLFVEHLGEFRPLVLRRASDVADSIFFDSETNTLSSIGDVDRDSELARIIADWLAD